MNRSALKEQLRKYVIEYKHSVGAFDFASGEEYDAYINDKQRLLLKKIHRATKNVISRVGAMTVEQYQKLLEIAQNLLAENEINIDIA